MPGKCQDMAYRRPLSQALGKLPDQIIAVQNLAEQAFIRGRMHKVVANCNNGTRCAGQAHV